MAANKSAANGLVRWADRIDFAVHPQRNAVAAAQTCAAIVASLALLCSSSMLLLSSAAQAASNKVRVTNLTDVNFGMIANLGSDAIQGQSLCLFADTTTNGYTVTATGAGPGGAFQLASGLSSMPYEVEWSDTSGRSSGVQLDANVPLTGQTSAASQQTCNNGPATTASLIVVLRSTALSSATAGSYNGTLTLVVGPE